MENDLYKVTVAQPGGWAGFLKDFVVDSDKSRRERCDYIFLFETKRWR